MAFGESRSREPHGYLTILSVALTISVRSKIAFFVEDEQICSGLVARAQERIHAIFIHNPVSIMPADLALYYNV